MTKQTFAEAECYDCHVILPKPEMIQGRAVTSSTRYNATNGVKGSSVHYEDIWRCQQCHNDRKDSMLSFAKIGIGIAAVLFFALIYAGTSERPKNHLNAPSHSGNLYPMHPATPGQTGAILPDVLKPTRNPPPNPHTNPSKQRGSSITPQSSPFLPCDALSANPTDEGKHPSAPGVDWKSLRAISSQAIKACQSALSEHPDNPRFQYQLARALQIEEPDEAEHLLRTLILAEYPAAYDNYGWLLIQIRKDVRSAEPYFRQGATLGNADAMQSLAVLLLKKRLHQRYRGEAMDLLHAAAERGNVDAQALSEKLDRRSRSDEAKTEAVKSLFRNFLSDNFPR